MYSTDSTELMDRGINCLLERLGVVETERFISFIIRERFDYTKWRRSYFGDVGVEEINKEAVAYSKEHPFVSKRLQGN